MSNQELGCLAGMRVLVASDNLIFQRFINHHLTQWQVSADFAMNGKKAVELVSENIYDAVLLDNMMPDLNVYDAAQAIRSMDGEYFRNLPIIVSARMPDFQKIRECGITGFFTDIPSLKENLYDIHSR